MSQEKLKGKVKYLLVKIAQCMHTHPDRRFVILCYHSIHPRKRYASATPEEFRAHLEWLAKNAEVVPLSQICGTFRSSQEVRIPRVAITFDDGYDDNYEWALPILKEFGMPATVFVTGGFVARDEDVIDRMARLLQCDRKEVQPLTVAQLREMVTEGIEIGAHTWSHPNLLRLTVDQQRAELLKSKLALEDWTGREVRSMAYPFGKKWRHFDEKTEEIARNVGYALAVSVCYRGLLETDSPYSLPRFVVTRDSTEVLAEKVRGVWDWLGRWQESAPRWLARIVTPADFRV
jgi:peptidoglycan/xylan/chitin deacetylase (PgdA/CDA1 family)